MWSTNYSNFCQITLFYNYFQTLNDLQSALTFINSRNDVSVTLVTANSGRLFGRLDMQPLLIDDVKSRKDTAFQLADAIRYVDILFCT